MIPQDAPPQDWALYYHDTYMTHITRGPVRIVVQNTDEGHSKELFCNRISKLGALSDAEPCEAADLRILWPRPGAYNFPKYHTAAFIGRTPQRHMKRSAYRDHYYPMWSPMPIAHTYLMCIIANNATYWTAESFAEECAKDKKKSISSVAISPKVILYTPPNSPDISLVYLGESIGKVIKGKFIPFMEHDSRLPRIMRHLSIIGLA